MSRKVIVEDLGLIDYQEAWNFQEQLFRELVDRKVRNRDLPEDEKEPVHHYLLFCEHPHVYTLGKSGSEDHLLLKPEELSEKGITYYRINRGGDITYHGPDQLVAYPILDLDHFFSDIHKYLRLLEEAVIITLSKYGISASRYPGFTGVWLDPDNPLRARKICAMGVRCSRWVTMHGLAFNINNDLGFFGNIIPCGINDKAVTSLERELGHKVPLEEVRAHLTAALSDLFEMELTSKEQFSETQS